MVALRLWPKQHLRVASSRFSANEQRKNVAKRSTVISTRVCVCICLSAIISPELHVRFLPIFTHVTHSRESVLLWRRSDKLRTSGFMDDVIFAHEPRLLDVAAQLKRSAHAVLGLVTNRG